MLFGGDTLAGTLLGDTWEWDGVSWTQVQDIGPSPRAFHSMAHDSARGRSVLFGGLAQAGEMGDTWEWDGENWTQVSDIGPSKRTHHAMAYDSSRQRVVLFGGGLTTRLGDTWEWDGQDWVQLDDTGPSARVSPAMVYDPDRSRLVLFGGAEADPGLGDTWERNGTTWTKEADFGPDPCAGGAMVSKSGRVTLFGGIGSLGPFPLNPPAPPVFSRTWEWDGKHWTARQDMGPGPRVFHAMAFDTDRSRIVLFGGSPVALNDPQATPRLFGDTWEQFETGAVAGGGTGGGTGGTVVDVAALDAVPNPVVQGNIVAITVTLADPAPGPASIALFNDGDPTTPFAEIQVAAGATSGTLDLPIAPNSVSASLGVEITARSGSSEASTVLIIKP